MVQRKLVEIDGRKYMSPSAAGDLWNMKHQAVTRACIDGRIVGATQDSSEKWIIPIEARKPLETEVIRQILICILVLKNRQESIDRQSLEDVNKVYQYLIDVGLIEKTDEKTIDSIRNLVLTDKGMKIATEGKHTNIKGINAGTTVVQLVASVITIWQGILII